MQLENEFLENLQSFSSKVYLLRFDLTQLWRRIRSNLTVRSVPVADMEKLVEAQTGP